jgi:alanine racemase
MSFFQGGQMEFNRPIWVEIDSTRLRNNYKKIKKLVGKRKIIGIVKADAYGHGAKDVTKILESEGIYGVAVASLEEALSLRSGKVKIPILTLGYIYPKTLQIAAKNNISVTMFDKNFLKRLKEYKGKEVLNIHIDVDTGMGRIGLDPKDVLESIEEIKKLNNVELQGIYTHFATADSDLKYAYEQLNIFKKILESLKSKNYLPELIHAANSASIINIKESYFNTVRPGILMYGLSPFTDRQTDFEPVMSFKARIIYTRNVGKNKGISYGKTFITQRESLLATIPVGYADGLLRVLSNNGEVLVKGKRAKIIGNITMDLTVIDVTNFPYIHPGNEVVIIGRQGDEEITASELAQRANTINYEIVTRIGKRVKRIYKA